MIYTVTFNPSLDYVVSVDNFQLGRTNRTTFEQIFPGGKGINVSTMLTNLGIESTALGFVAGFTGAEIIRAVEQAGVKAEFIHLTEGISRINVKLQSVNGTEINGSGPIIPKMKADQLIKRLDTLKMGDVLILAGSIPSSIPDCIYKDIMERLQGRGVLFIVDASGDLLVNVLAYHPFLIKPNKDELEEIFRVELCGRADIIRYGRELQVMGARNVLVSVGGDGAVLITENGKVYDKAAPKGVLVNAVGSGDAMVAGFLAGWLEQKDYMHAFCMGISAGSASAFSEYLAKRREVEQLYVQLIKEEV